jgi:twitching motility protein PilT
MQLSFAQIAEHAASVGASDIHISSNMPPALRVDDLIREMRVSTQTIEDVTIIISSLMTAKQLSTFKEGLEIKFTYEAPNGMRYRTNVFNTISGPAASLRIIPNKLPTLDDLDAPYILRSLVDLESGLLLIAGLAGSGKTTTIAAIIGYINRNSSRRIITIEDPIEFIHKSDKSLISQREIGTNSSSYDKALKSAVYEDPDIIVIDELQEPEHIKLALLAAEAGYLVISTTNATSYMQAIHGILNTSSEDNKAAIRNMLANSLAGIVHQKLIPKAGKSGRVAAYEVIPINPTIKSLISSNKELEIQDIIEAHAVSGMITMDTYIQKLITRGIIREDYKSNGFSHLLNSDETEF